MKVDWAGKLSSRKFWSLIIALITALLVCMNVDPDSIEKITAIVGAFASIVVYILAEAYIDAQRAATPIIQVIHEELEE